MDTREYQYARISEHTSGTVPNESDLQEGTGAFAANESVPLPIQSQTEVAVETGDIQVVTRNQTDSRFDRWRAYTLDQGFQGGAFVPLQYRVASTIYSSCTQTVERHSGAASRHS